MTFRLFSKLNKLMQNNSDNLNKFDENTFYPAFIKDLKNAKSEVIIESPYLTQKRLNTLLSEFKKLRNRNVRIIINTKEPDEHDEKMKIEALICVYELQSLGVEVFYTYGLHRKIAIVDKKILWESSLNILSQAQSRELMRRTCSQVQSRQMIKIIKSYG